MKHKKTAWREREKQEYWRITIIIMYRMADAYNIYCCCGGAVTALATGNSNNNNNTIEAKSSNEQHKLVV